MAALLLGSAGFLPQFGGPGYESALAGGLVLPSIAAVTTAWVVAAAASAESRLFCLDALGRGALIGSALSLVGVSLATLHGLRVGFCDAPLGYELWATGPGPGAVMGGAWGAGAGLLARRFARRRLLAVLLALAGPVGGIALGFGRFYSSPMVFGFDPFVGYFAGPLYDTVVDPGTRLLSYRFGSLSSLLSAAVLAFHLELGARERLRCVWRGRPGLVAAGAVALTLSLAVTLSGTRLGHYSTTHSIEEGLGRATSAGRCDVVYSSSIAKADADRVARECTAHLPQIERYLAARGPERVRVFLFASDAEKGAYMGASHTYIAKPWRREVYVQAAGFPHPTLGHELAHVVSGSFGVGPFRVAGPLAGLIPDPGRIEGVAVAASPGEDEDFTLLEWSKALLDLGLLPNLDSVFRLGFLAKSSNTAYTVAGAFVSFLHDRYGAAVVRGWYGGQPLATLTGGKSLGQLDAEFRAELGHLVLRPELSAMAKARFDRPSLFGRVCPRRVDRELGLAEARLFAGDTRGARQAFEALLALEHDSTRGRLGLAQCDVRDADLEQAHRRYQELANDPRLSVLERAAALEARGDVDVMADHPAQAVEAYRAVAKVDADDDRQRTLEVKSLLALSPKTAGLRPLLIGDPHSGPSWDEAAPLLGAEAAEGDPLSQYLLGRNLWLHGRAEAGLRYLAQSLDGDPQPPRRGSASFPPPISIVRESLRLYVLIACSDPRWVGDQARAAFRRFDADPAVPAAKKAAVRRLAERCGL